MLIKIDNNINELTVQGGTNATALIVKFDTLKTEVTSALNDASGTTIDMLSAKVSSLSSKLVELEIEKNNLLIKDNTFTFKEKFKMVTVYLGIMFGIMIAMNKFWPGHRTDMGILYTLLYGLWGAILYPVVLLYGIYDTPSWLALFPLFDIKDYPKLQFLSYMFGFKRPVPKVFIGPNLPPTSPLFFKTFIAIVTGCCYVSYML